MDAKHFDQIARSLNAAGTRRGVLRLLTTLPVVGGLLALLDVEEGEAGRRHRRKASHTRGKGRNKKKCKAKSKGKTCKGKCGTVKDNCKKKVNCGACGCDPECDVCETCNSETLECEALAGCCEAPADCPPPPNACQQNTCVENECGVEPISPLPLECCLDPADCSTSGICLEATCVANLCGSEPTTCTAPQACCAAGSPFQGQCRLPFTEICVNNADCCSNNCQCVPMMGCTCQG